MWSRALPNSIQDVFARHDLSVSRETLDKLQVYQALLNKWQKAINLVGLATLDDAAERHFFDSAQLLVHIPDNNIRLADLGSGAGFPGMVLAILGIKDVHLVESDVRKATFLREVSRETSTPVTIHDRRVEDVSIADVDLVTARALAPLRDLLGYLDQIRTEGHAISALFQKGVQFEEEIEKAKKKWIFDEEVFESKIDTESKIIKISNLSKK
jgi:16S rRNA (guanine527-N7)-methyltransferase